MNCADFLVQLDTCIETRTTPPVPLQQHGIECQNSECRNAWDDFLLLNEAICDWKVGRQSPVPVHSSRTFRSGIRRMAGGLVAAAACAGAVFVVPFLSSPQPLQTAERPPAAERGSSETVMIVSRQKSAGEEIDGFSIDWIAVTPERVSNSMASLLLGNQEPVHDVPADGKWLDGWRQQILPIEENFEVIRGLLMEREENQTYLGPFSQNEPLS